jgi:hypothetical protein
MPRPTGSGLKVLAVGLLGLILLVGLYVGSIGPVMRLAVRRYLDAEMVLTFYKPVFLVTARSELARHVVTRYLIAWDAWPGD